MKKQNMILVLTIVLTSLFNMDIYAQQNSGSHEHRAKMKCCSSTNRIAMSDSTKMMRNKNQKMMKHRKQPDKPFSCFFPADLRRTGPQPDKPSSVQ